MRCLFLTLVILILGLIPTGSHAQQGGTTSAPVDSAYFNAVYKALAEELTEGVSQAVDETLASYRAFAPEVPELVWSTAMQQVRNDAIADYIHFSTTLMVHYFPPGTLENEDYELPRNLRRQMENDRQRLLLIWAGAVHEKADLTTLMLQDSAIAQPATPGKAQ